MTDSSRPDLSSDGGAPGLPQRRPDEPSPPAQDALSQGDQYRLVTDLVAGPNLRWRDNLFQAAFILVAVLVSTGIGAVFYGVEGAVLGGAGGTIGGLFLSGVALGVYRAYCHARGHHR